MYMYMYMYKDLENNRGIDVNVKTECHVVYEGLGMFIVVVKGSHRPSALVQLEPWLNPKKAPILNRSVAPFASCTTIRAYIYICIWLLYLYVHMYVWRSIWGNR